MDRSNEAQQLKAMLLSVARSSLYTWQMHVSHKNSRIAVADAWMKLCSQAEKIIHHVTVKIILICLKQACASCLYHLLYPKG